MVSIVFADVVGFTSRAERLDVEDVEGFLARYHGLVRRELERHGGTVEKFIGDAVMAIFGAPVAHEDDAERAVRAALSIQDAVAERREHQAVDVHVRAGVTTGEALVVLGAQPQTGEGMAAGEVVNTAARLETAAPADGVLVDEWTYRATDRVIRYEAAESVAAKGKSAPVAAWRAVSPRALIPERPWQQDVPLVGRERELRLLDTILDRARTEPSTELVTLVGAPGIGKTRLVEELARHIEELPTLTRWRAGRSLAYGDGVAFWALREIARAECGILDSDPPKLASSKLDDAIAAVIVDEDDREWVRHYLGPLVGLKPRGGAHTTSARSGAFAAWRRFIEALAEAGPTVLVFEDIQWADDALLDFIDLLADQAGTVPLLIVCTARPELLTRRAGWGGGKLNSQTILLAPLTDAETARLISQLLNQTLLPAATQQALLSRAEGNALFAQEYVRMLQDRSPLVPEAGSWRLTAAPASIPETVQAIIGARLDTLGDVERRFLHDAAVIGRIGWSGAVGAVGDAPPEDADALVGGLERKQFVRRHRGSSIAGETEFSFTHALIQDVAYGQIRRAERAQKHERAAAWFESRVGERADQVELVAHHYSAALTLRTEVGDETAILTEKTRAALAQAARRAESMRAHELAVGHVQAALRFTSEDDPLRAELLLLAVRAGSYAGTAGETTYAAALEAQRAIGDWQAAAEVCVWWHNWYVNSAANASRAEEVLREAAEYSARVGYSHVESQLREEQAFVCGVTGRFAEAARITEEGIARAERAGDREGCAMMLARHGFVLMSQGDPRGIAELRDAADALDHLPDAECDLSVVAHWNHAEALVAAGDLATAAEARRAALRWANRSGSQPTIDATIQGSAQVAYHDGDWDAAARILAPQLHHAMQDVAAQARVWYAPIALARGQLEEAAALAERVIQFGKDTRNGEYRLGGLALAALVKSAGGNVATSPAALDDYLQLWPAIGGAYTAPELAQLMTAMPSDPRLRQAAEELPDFSAWRAAILAVADDRYVEAAQRFGAIGSKPRQADAQLLAAKAFLSNGEDAEATRHAQLAADFYRRVRATLYLPATEAIIRSARHAVIAAS